MEMAVSLSWVALLISSSVLFILVLWTVTYVAARLAALAWYRTKREDLEHTLNRINDLTPEERKCNGA